MFPAATSWVIMKCEHNKKISNKEERQKQLSLPYSIKEQQACSHIYILKKVSCSLRASCIAADWKSGSFFSAHNARSDLLLYSCMRVGGEQCVRVHENELRPTFNRGMVAYSYFAAARINRTKTNATPILSALDDRAKILSGGFSQVREDGGQVGIARRRWGQRFSILSNIYTYVSNGSAKRWGRAFCFDKKNTKPSQKLERIYIKDHSPDRIFQRTRTRE